MKSWYIIKDGIDPNIGKFRSTFSTVTNTVYGFTTSEHGRSYSGVFRQESTSWRGTNDAFDPGGGGGTSQSRIRHSTSYETSYDVGAVKSGSSYGETYSYGTTSYTGTAGVIVSTMSAHYIDTMSSSSAFGPVSNTYFYTRFFSFTQQLPSGNSSSSSITTQVISNAVGVAPLAPTSTILHTALTYRWVTLTYAQTGSQTSYTTYLGSLTTTTVSENQTLTYVGASYDKTRSMYTYGSYNTRQHYLQWVYEADISEVLYSATTTGAGIGYWSDHFVSFTRTTISDFASYSDGTPQNTETLLANTWTYSYWNASLVDTVTVSNFVYSTVTMDLFDGVLPPTAITERQIYGYSTAEMEVTYGTNTTFDTYVGFGAVSRSKLYSYASNEFYTISFDGLTPDGGITDYTAVTWVDIPVYYTVPEYSQGYGQSSTKYYMYGVVKDHVEYYDGIYVAAHIKANGFQALSNHGPMHPQGLSLTADNSFYVGTRNTGLGEQYAGIIPFNIYSTASNGNTSYSYSHNNNGNWSITTDNGTTNGSFEANVGIQGVKDVYQLIGDSRVDTTLPMVFGGTNQDTKVQNIVTFIGYGHRWTLGDLLGTTSYSTQLTAPYSVMNIGSSVLAYENLRIQPYATYTQNYPAVTAMAYSSLQ